MNPINDTGDDTLWCPMCNRTAPRATLCGTWVHTNPRHVMVCRYLLCNQCSVRFKKMGERTLANTSAIIECNLLEHYPELRLKLPPDYKLRPTEGEGFSA